MRDIHVVVEHGDDPNDWEHISCATKEELSAIIAEVKPVNATVDSPALWKRSYIRFSNGRMGLHGKNVAAFDAAIHIRHTVPQYYY